MNLMAVAAQLHSDAEPRRILRLGSLAGTIDDWAQSFAAAPPGLLGQRELQKRLDIKFVLPAAVLPMLFRRLPETYVALTVPSGNVALYQSQYFDTESLQCFHDHRRGKRLRYKVRIRHYPDRELSFVEVKAKRNSVVTAKFRRAIPYGQRALTPADVAFVEAQTTMVQPFEHVVDNEFSRLTLLSTKAEERVTIDFAISLRTTPWVGARFGHTPEVDFSRLAVVEVKQGHHMHSDILDALRGAHVREASFSKYTIGLAMALPSLRQNRLRPNVRAIAKRIP